VDAQSRVSTLSFICGAYCRPGATHVALWLSYETRRLMPPICQHFSHFSGGTLNLKSTTRTNDRIYAILARSKNTFFRAKCKLPQGFYVSFVKNQNKFTKIWGWKKRKNSRACRKKVRPFSKNIRPFFNEVNYFFSKAYFCLDSPFYFINSICQNFSHFFWTPTIFFCKRISKQNKIYKFALEFIWANPVRGFICARTWRVRYI
jgi:hypothetical protein